MNMNSLINYPKQRRVTITIIIVLVFLFGWAINAAVAQGILPKPTGSAIGCASDNCGNYSLNDFVSLGINVAQFMLGIVGSLALLFFIYGGIKMIIAAGASDKIEEAKNIIKNAVIGLVIVFVSWTIINFTYKALMGDNYIKQKSWYQI